VVHRLSRGVDVRDVADGFLRAVGAPLDDHVCVNAGGPLLFGPDDRAALVADPAAVLDRRVPWLRAAFAARGWALPERIDRVYDSTAAAAMLGHHPRRGVAHALAAVADGHTTTAHDLPTAC
jgi:nucleoside-diphosphate-sugar epimerase